MMSPRASSVATRADGASEAGAAQVLPGIRPSTDTSAARVHRELIALVMAGELQPGDALSEVALAERFQVSRTPVREAIQRLAQSGLAQRGPRRTYVLREMRSDALDDAFEALGEIEALAAGLAAHRMSEVERRRLEELVEQGAALVGARDGREYAANNVAFHDAVLDGAHNETLREMATLVRLRLSPYRDQQFVRSDRLASSQAEHDELLRAVLARDADQATRRMRRHLASTALNVRRMMDTPRARRTRPST